MKIFLLDAAPAYDKTCCDNSLILEVNFRKEQQFFLAREDTEYTSFQIIKRLFKISIPLHPCSTSEDMTMSLE